MSRKRRKSETTESVAPQQPPAVPPAKDKGPESSDLLLVAHASDLTEAELYKTELKTHGIPAVLGGEGAAAGVPDVGAGVPVLVPEEMADEAAELIAEMESSKTEGHPLDEKEETLDTETEDLEDIDDIDAALEDKDFADDEDDEEEEDDDLDDDEDDEDEDDDWEDDDDEDEEEEDWDDDEDWGDDDD